MYSFTSSNDFGNKTGYVSDVTHNLDWIATAPVEFYPLEQLYEFDNLFQRFSTEIASALAGNGNFDSGNLIVARFYVLHSDGTSATGPQLTNYYLCVRVTASTTEVRVYRGALTSKSGTLSNYVSCPAADYLNGTHKYNIGRIFLINFREVDTTNGGLRVDESSSRLYMGDTKGYIGTYQEPTSSYPKGKMVYTFSTYTLPSLINPGTAAQTGYPNTIENRRNQPELVGELVDSKQDSGLFWGWEYQPMLVSTTGEYDPDPTPPGPGPGPTPSSDPNDRDPEPNNKEDMGGGPHTPTSDPIPVPGLPPVGPLSGGACMAFVLDSTEFADFNSRLHDPTAWQAIKQYFNDPMDFLVGCVCLPFLAPYFGYQYPKFGTYVWPVHYRVCREQFIEIDCGSVLCSAYYGSCFDYSPYTKVQLWLPFIGFVQLDPDEVMEMQISVKYHVDCMTGDCVAYVSTGSSVLQPRVLGIYNGNCGMQTPMARTSYDNVISCAFGLVGAAASAGAGYVGGGAALGAMAESGAKEASVAAHRAGLNAHLASRLASSTMSAVAGAKTTSIKSGTTGGALGFMGVLTPYLLIHTPRQSKPSNYIGMKGYPSNIGGIIGDFTGYVEFSDVRLNVPALENEVDEIYELLKGGVLI